MESVLNIENLRVTFDAHAGPVYAVRGVSLQVQAGEVLALVGESGCGKSVTAQAVLRLNPSPPAQVQAQALTLCGVDVLHASEREMEAARGTLAGMIFQDPMTSLNPTMKVGNQVTEALRLRGRVSPADCEREAVRLLELVRIPDAALRAKQYPHSFSGGMRQRVMIAMALASSPKLLIADEPTTALDTTTQLQILRLLYTIRRETGTAVLLITHDLSVVANTAERVAVMYAGKLVEEAPVRRLFSAPAHPYTVGLLESLPRPGAQGPLASIPGAPPDLSAPPPGCAFAPRCKHSMRLCLQKAPPLLAAGPEHRAACWLLHPDCPKGGTA